MASHVQTRSTNDEEGAAEKALPKVQGIADMTNYKRGSTFYMVFFANLVVDLLSALDLTAVSTALPTIVQRLDGNNFIWAGSAYTVASTAILPLIGGLVSVFGRRPTLLAFVSIFAIGSAICGAAQNLPMFIAGRTIQGIGGGACVSITQIIYADLVPLPERGKFMGIIASVWAFACAIGPPIGGAFVNSGSWRWLFFMNLPLCGIALVLEFIFLRVHTPKDSFRAKIVRMDWLGIVVIIGSILSVMVGLAWAGVQFAWTSVQVLVPLILGIIGFIAFFMIESLCTWIKEPTIPWYILTNRTTLSGFLATAVHGLVSMAAIYYLPVYFQASIGASAIGSGVDFFGTALVVAPCAIITGATVEIFKKYRPQNYLGWVLMIAGFGLLTLLDENSSRAAYIGYQTLLAVGLGIIWIAPEFPILAPLPYSNNAHALAFFTFVRCFTQSWGIVVGGTILQNTLHKRLPQSFQSSLPNGAETPYAIIPIIHTLQDPLKSQVRAAFAEGTHRIWIVMAGVSGAGLLSCLLMREEELRTDMDAAWGLKESPEADSEASTE